MKLDYGDILIVPKKSNMKSRKDVSLVETYSFKNSSIIWSGVPICASNMDGVGTFSMARTLCVEKMLTFITKHHSKSDWKKNITDEMIDYVAVSTGTSDEDIDNAIDIFKTFNLKWICLDMANGYSSIFIDKIKKIRYALGEKAIIVAGNVVTSERTVEAINAGADIVKVGIGPGSVCTTRIQTGVGYPQFSAVYECSHAAESVGGAVMADGGCTCPGDVSKSFCAGAKFSMLGGMFAGHYESEAEIVVKTFKSGEVVVTTNANGKIETKDVLEEKMFVSFYGMSSDTAMKKHSGGVANYRSSEGRTVMIPLKQSLIYTIRDLLGGIRSTCTYIGASCISEMFENFDCVRASRQFNSVYLK